MRLLFVLALFFLWCCPLYPATFQIFALPTNIYISEEGLLFDHLSRKMSDEYKLQNWVWDVSQNSVFLGALQGERVGFQLIVDNLNDSEFVYFPDVTDLKSKTNRLQSESIELYLQAKIMVSENRISEKEELVLIPVKENEITNGISHPPKSLKRFWVDINVPKEQPAGLYAGKITLSMLSGYHLSVKVILEVYPVSLPNTADFTAAGIFNLAQFYKWYARVPSLLGSPETALSLFDIFRCLDKHHFLPVIANVHPYINSEDSASFIWDEYNDLMKKFYESKSLTSLSFSPFAFPLHKMVKMCSPTNLNHLMKKYIDHQSYSGNGKSKRIIYYSPGKSLNAELSGVLNEIDFPESVILLVVPEDIDKSQILKDFPFTCNNIWVIPADSIPGFRNEQKKRSRRIWISLSSTEFPMLNENLLYRDLGSLAFFLGVQGVFFSQINSWVISGSDGYNAAPLIYPNPQGEPLVTMRLKRLYNAFQDYCLLSGLVSVADSSVVQSYLARIFECEERVVSIKDIPFSDDPEILNEIFHRIKLDIVRFRYPEYLARIQKQGSFAPKTE